MLPFGSVFLLFFNNSPKKKIDYNIVVSSAKQMRSAQEIILLFLQHSYEVKNNQSLINVRSVKR